MFTFLKNILFYWVSIRCKRADKRADTFVNKSNIILQQKSIAFSMFDFPEAFGANKPTDFNTGTPFLSMALDPSSRASAVSIQIAFLTFIS